ncbi:MAG: hypothetical protein JWO46_1827 [Nocardioidaceae bacterium]|nr:hypothetical protein [Nocardioidaceae bacterium]
MTEPIPEITETQSAIDAGIAMGEPQPLDEANYPHAFATLVPKGGELFITDLRTLHPELNPRPARKTGTVHVQNSDSFVDYLAKHALPETEVYADGAKFALVAVINAHQDAKASSGEPDAVSADQGAGWGDHRCSLELINTPAWTTWLSLNKQWLTQQQFAEHIEDNAQDVIDPDSATMLEIAQHFIAAMGTDFKSVTRLSSSEVKFNYEETVSARVGETGDLDVPTTFTLELAPFVGGEPHVITARFRYRLRSGQLSLSYHLVRPEEVIEQAFNAHVAAVESRVEAPVFAGRPRLMVNGDVAAASATRVEHLGGWARAIADGEAHCWSCKTWKPEALMGIGRCWTCTRQRRVDDTARAALDLVVAGDSDAALDLLCAAVNEHAAREGLPADARVADTDLAVAS